MNEGERLGWTLWLALALPGGLGCAGLAEGVEKCCDGGDGGLADGVLPNCSL